MPKARAFLAVGGHAADQPGAQALVGLMKPNLLRALIQRGALRCTERASQQEIGDAPRFGEMTARVRQLRAQVLVFAMSHFQKCHYNSANCSGAAGFSIPKA